MDDKSKSKSNGAAAQAQVNDVDDRENAYDLEETLKRHAENIKAKEEAKWKELDKNVTQANTWLFANKERDRGKNKTVLTEDKGLLVACYLRITKCFGRFELLKRDLSDIEASFDRSISSFFRLLKDHVNDSVIDFLIYSGFNAYNFFKIYTNDREQYE